MRLPILLIYLLVFSTVSGQYAASEQKLIKAVDLATSEKEKIASLEKLAEFYYIYNAGNKGDSILQYQLTIAQSSSNKELILNALFGNALTLIKSWSSKETFDKALAFLDIGLTYAQESGKKEYEALAFVRKAGLYRKRGDYDQALQFASLALASLTPENDSLKASIYLENGDVFLAKGKYVFAYKNYNNAFDLAYNIENFTLQSKAYHHFSELYKKLHDSTVAHKFLQKSLDLNLAKKNEIGLIEDYIGLARLTNKRNYIDAAEVLAIKHGIERYKYYCKRLLYSYYMVEEKNSALTLKYLEENDDLRQALLNNGIASYHYDLGHIYFYSNQPDSALRYYLIAAPELLSTFDALTKASVLKQLGECYAAAGKDILALPHYLHSLEIAKEYNDADNSAELTDSLSKLYGRIGDYKTAYQYVIENQAFVAAVIEQKHQRDVVLMDVERENRQHEKDLADAQSASIKTRNLQYMGISLATAGFFIILVFFGMFPVSRLSIKMLSFFAFICLFEFIILLIDTWLHELAHGEPLKIWLAKIAIIAVLLPLHHYLDHVSYRFLSSHKLQKLRERFSVKKIVSRIKVTAPTDPASSVMKNAEEKTTVA